MKGIAFNFFFLAAVCVTGGMIWGLQMAISGDHLMAPAHAHLNLVGWVTLGLFGIYYHLTPHAAVPTLATIHFWVALAGVVLIVPGIAIARLESGEAIAAIGSILTLASMLIFLATVWRHGFGAKA